MAKNSAEKALESIPSMRLLVAVCRKKSLTEAAKGLGMSLSAASHQLSVLKDAAGDPLGTAAVPAACGAPLGADAETVYYWEETDAGPNLVQMDLANAAER